MSDLLCHSFSVYVPFIFAVQVFCSVCAENLKFGDLKFLDVSCFFYNFDWGSNSLKIFYCVSSSIFFSNLWVVTASVTNHQDFQDVGKLSDSFILQHTDYSFYFFIYRLISWYIKIHFSCNFFDTLRQVLIFFCSSTFINLYVFSTAWI